MNARRHRFIDLLVCVAAVFVVTMARPVVADAPPATSLEGKPAPELTLQQLDGRAFKLSELKGKVVVLDWWATWCAPCVEALPHLDALGQDKALADRGLRIFAVNFKEKPATVEKFVKEKGLKLPVPLDARGEAGKAYLVSQYPTTVIIGRDGVVKKVFDGIEDAQDEKLKQAIEAALNEGK